MGFFSDLKEDLSQAVNELMPEELVEETADGEMETDGVTQTVNEEMNTGLSLEEMLENIDNIMIPEADENGDSPAMVSAGESWAEGEPVESVMESIVEDVVEEPQVEAYEYQETGMEENIMDDKGADSKMDSYTNRQVADETAVITAGMQIKGNITSEGSLDVVGSVEGNIDVWGKLNVTGHVIGNSQAAEVYAEGAKITGEIVSTGAVKIGNSSVILGNITAKSAAIAGAVKGDIDVQGPVILDASAIVMGNIKSKSVQINNGAVIEGMCSQCYADVSPMSFFDEYKTEIKSSKKSK